MIRIDGAKGEGGGQILRTALSLAMCLNENIEVKHIRAGRIKPGMLRQHYTCAQAANAISHGQMEGLYVGSESLVFKPGNIKDADTHYQFAIGTAGSTGLVFQTILPALLLTPKPVTIELMGGTHVPYSPTLEFIRHAFLPALKSMGIEAEINLELCGFYPAGGGKWSVTVHPWTQARALDLCERGKLVRKTANAMVCNLSQKIAERELNKINWPQGDSVVQEVNGIGSGNVVSLQMQYEHVNTVVDSIGRFQKSAEKVANEAINRLARYELTRAPVCDYLADQLLLPMVLGKGGRFVTQDLSLHTQTNIDVIQQMTGLRIRQKQLNQHQWLIEMPWGLGLME